MYHFLWKEKGRKAAKQNHYQLDKKQQRQAGRQAGGWVGGDLYLQSSKVVPGDAKARRLRSSSLSLVTWRSWNRIVSRLSPAGRLSLMAGGGEDASPFTGEPATASTLVVLVLALH